MGLAEEMAKLQMQQTDDYMKNSPKYWFQNYGPNMRLPSGYNVGDLPMSTYYPEGGQPLMGEDIYSFIKKLWESQTPLRQPPDKSQWQWRFPTK